ncbi:MAG: site-2 protease family protein [Burkholderiales bacterium]
MLDALPSLATLYAIGFVAVLAHEYGHAYAAARFGGRVESLNIGFGPALFSCAISAGRLSTRVYIRLLLIGGYVAIDEKSVAALPRTKRIVISLGGVLMNAAMAILAFAWLSYYPKAVEPLQHVVQALPAKYTGGKALLPDGEQYILRSLKQSEAKTEWEFEPLTLSSQDSKVMVLPKACGGDCDSLLRRDLGIELSQAFRGEPDSGSGKTGFVVLSLNGNRFGNRYAFHDFLSAAARDNTVLSVEAICGNHFCNGSYGARELLAYRWHSTPVRDHQVVSGGRDTAKFRSVSVAI